VKAELLWQARGGPDGSFPQQVQRLGIEHEQIATILLANAQN
jgi:hypothetical protein